ncbi:MULTISPECIES: putative quinol monooxygenase [Neorhizobium]|uniref:putative quinol monooxygenase n=1 Tax=Neorhizobium TaxID=1525371 RepID=UPI001FE23F43|nr:MULTISPECIES: antibiotic biosynthesis monooxygenase [Neorhizobium]
MIIIAGYTRTDAKKRDSTVEAFSGMVERARAYDGCLDFSISADAVDPERVNLFECWRGQTALDAWRKIAKGPARETSRGRREPPSRGQGRKTFLRTSDVDCEDTALLHLVDIAVVGGGCPVR